MSNCPYHADHENRIKRLESCMEKIEQSNPKIIIAILGLIGAIFSTLGSVTGVVLVAYLKSNGMM